MRTLRDLDELKHLLARERPTGLVRLCPQDETLVMTEAQRVTEVFPALQIFLVKGTIDDEEMEERTAQFLKDADLGTGLLTLPHWWILWRGKPVAVFKQSGAFVHDLLGMLGGKGSIGALIEWIEKMLDAERGTGRIRARAAQQAQPQQRAQGHANAQAPRAGRGGAQRDWKSAPTAPRGHAPLPPDPFRVLGITPEASAEEIRHAYRALCARFHPDKFARAGRAQQEAAHRRIVEINAAYERLKTRKA